MTKISTNVPLKEMISAITMVIVSTLLDRIIATATSVSLVTYFVFIC